VESLYELLRSWGLLGVFLIAAFDSAGIPLPAVTDSVLVGVAIVSPARAYFAAVLAIVGSMAGNYFLFSVARKGGEAYLDKQTESGRAKKFREWFQRYGLITVFIPTLVPILPLPLKVFVLSAGALGVNRRTFLLTILAGRVPRFLAMAYLGAQLGENSMAWLQDHVGVLVAIAVGVAVVLAVIVRWAGRQNAAD